jgi:hypothetical protein
MRWLMVGLLVSVGALLVAVAGVARHILLQRATLRRKKVTNIEIFDDPIIPVVEETDLEP